MFLDLQVILFVFGDLIVYDLLIFCFFGVILDSFVLKDVGFKFVEFLNFFLQFFVQYMEMNLYDFLLYIVKQWELFYILNFVYNEQEFVILFSFLMEQLFRFKEQILENYFSVKNVGELVSLLGYGVINFWVKFKEQFGVLVYCWFFNWKL